MNKFLVNTLIKFFDNPFIASIYFLMIIGFFGMLYLSYINGDKIFRKEELQIFNIVIRYLSRNIILSFIILCLFLIYFEKKNSNLTSYLEKVIKNKDLQTGFSNLNIKNPDPDFDLQQAMIDTMKEFFTKREIQLLFIYLPYKGIFKILESNSNKLNVDNKYLFILDAFMMFILTGYFNDSQEIQIILIVLNMINIVIGCYRLLYKNIELDNTYLTENILFLYIIISILIKND